MLSQEIHCKNGCAYSHRTVLSMPTNLVSYRGCQLRTVCGRAGLTYIRMCHHFVHHRVAQQGHAFVCNQCLVTAVTTTTCTQHIVVFIMCVSYTRLFPFVSARLHYLTNPLSHNCALELLLIISHSTPGVSATLPPPHLVGLQGGLR